MQSNEVNALPERVRRYIHDLETRCDPAGEVRDLWQAREQRDALAVAVNERDADLARLRAEVLARSEDLSAAMVRTNGLEEANRTLRAELEAAKAERDSARAALDKERAYAHKAYEIVCDEREKLHEALKIERACVDDYRCGHVVALEKYEEASECRVWAGTDYRCDLCKEVDARRAAEAKEPPHA